MAIAESLKALGISIEDPRSVAEGLNKLILPKEHKLKLFREYVAERDLKDTEKFEELIRG